MRDEGVVVVVEGEGTLEKRKRKLQATGRKISRNNKLTGSMA